jgi:hypothetical protein
MVLRRRLDSASQVTPVPPRVGVPSTDAKRLPPYHAAVDSPSRTDVRRATALGGLSAVPLLAWWAGWAPAIMSSDSIDQWNQALTFDFVNTHPILHTVFLWLTSLIWASPASVTLMHVVVTTVLLAVVARRLVQLGVGVPFAVGIVWIIAILPMTGAVTVTMWKDVPFSLAMLWVVTELLLMARNKVAFWAGIWGPGRLGIALGLVWALRANGRLTAAAFALALAVAFRSLWRGVTAMLVGVLAVGVALPLALIAALPVTDAPIEPAQVFMPDVASVVVNDPGDLSAGDLVLVQAVAPLRVFEDFYACGDSTPLLFHPEYDNQEIRENPSAYRGLILRTGLGSFPTVLGHRWCAAEYLFSPINRTDTFVHRPPFEIWPNTLGLARDPISERAFDVTFAMYRAAEQSEIEWLTWRPALVVLMGLATAAAVWWRRGLRPLRWIGAFYVIHLVNAAVTSPAHEFRYAYGLYLISLATFPLWILVADPARAAISGGVSDASSGVGRTAPGADEPAGDANRDPQQPDGDNIWIPDQVPAGDSVDREEHDR